MKETIENAFPQIVGGACLEVLNETEFYIFDSPVEPKRCFISEKDSDPAHFTVNNPAAKVLSFLAIDKCLLDDGQPARCDCAVFEDSKFAFIEISDSKKLHRNKKRKHAVDQLGNTIDLFRGKGIMFPEELNAIICFVGKKIHPARTSQKSAASVLFYDERKAILLEGNELSF
jgi:hypothetical protein